MKTDKGLLLKQRLNFSRKVQQPIKMQNPYQNWSCVLDPAIALSHYGVLVAESISKEIELWVVQELWNIVNDAEFYADRTELIIPQTIAVKERAVAAEAIWSLKEWSKTKQEKDLAKLGMYWLGDNLQESLLPKNKPVEFFGQWQNSATALDRRYRATQQDNNILTSAFRDTIALAASLKSAFILTYQPATDPSNSSPSICKALENWEIPFQLINKRNPIVTMERQYIRQLIVRAGLGKLLLAGVNLAAFHLVIPAVPTVNTPHDSPLSPLEPSHNGNLERENYFWNNVKGVWYSL